MEIQDIQKYDPNFLESKFKSFVDNTFIQIHLAIMSKDLERVRHFMSEEVYQKFCEKVNQLNGKGYIQMYDEINVKQTTLLGVEISGEDLFLKVNITSRYMDYIVDQNMNFIQGNQNSRVEKENYLTFRRRIGKQEEKSIRRCTSCGHPLDIHQNGKCSYCGAIYDLERDGWQLVSFEVQ